MRRLTLIGANGQRFDLNSASGRYMAGRDVGLWGGPPVEMSEQFVLNKAGARVTQVRHLPREVVLPIVVLGEDDADADDALSDLMVATDPARGQVRVLVERGDGSQRELSAYNVGGHEGLTMAMANTAHIIVPLRLRATDPYWRDVREREKEIVSTEFEGGGEPTPSDAPISSDAPIPSDGFNPTGFQFFPVDLTSGIEVWPRWEATGPGARLTAVNLTTGKLWSYEPALANGARFLMDTQPGVRHVSVNDANAFANLTEDSQLWSLVPGRNWVGLRLQNWVAGTSKVRLFWRERHLTC